MIEPSRFYDFHKWIGGAAAKAVLLLDQMSDVKKNFIRGLDDIVSKNGDDSNFMVLKGGKSFYLKPIDREANESKSLKEILL